MALHALGVIPLLPILQFCSHMARDSHVLKAMAYARLYGCMMDSGTAIYMAGNGQQEHDGTKVMAFVPWCRSCCSPWGAMCRPAQDIGCRRSCLRWLQQGNLSPSKDSNLAKHRQKSAAAILTGCDGSCIRPGAYTMGYNKSALAVGVTPVWVVPQGEVSRANKYSSTTMVDPRLKAEVTPTESEHVTGPHTRAHGTAH